MARRRSSNLLPTMFMAGIEAQQVIGLRMMRLALGGPAAEREASLMLQEKLDTASRVYADAVCSTLAGGGAGVPAASLATYRRKMRANRRRLLRGG